MKRLFAPLMLTLLFLIVPIVVFAGGEATTGYSELELLKRGTSVRVEVIKDQNPVVQREVVPAEQEVVSDKSCAECSDLNIQPRSAGDLQQPKGMDCLVVTKKHCITIQGRNRDTREIYWKTGWVSGPMKYYGNWVIDEETGKRVFIPVRAAMCGNLVKDLKIYESAGHEKVTVTYHDMVIVTGGEKYYAPASISGAKVAPKEAEEGTVIEEISKKK